MTRLSHILSYYAAWIKNKQSLNEIYEETTAQNDGDRDIHMFEVMNSGKYLGAYNNSKLLNDFHHIVERHHYHTIQQLLVSCGASDGCYMESDLCQLLVRNYRNRNSGATHEEKQEEYRCGLYFGYATSTEVATQQILDAIHCFVYHSYDLGHTLTASQLYLLNNHEREYKHQNIIYSPRQKTHATRPTRQSILYNQKIDVATLTQHDDDDAHESGTEETEDSLSHTPNTPNPMETVPQTRPLSLSFVAPIVTINNPNKKKCDKDEDQKHELKKRIELSNSKMVILQQILSENENDYIEKMMCAKQGKSNKYVHVLSSYKHLIFEFEPDSASSRPVTPTPTDDSKENNEADVIQNSLTLPPTERDAKNNKKGKKGKHGKALSISFGKLRRVKSDTGENVFKAAKKKNKLGKKGGKSHRTLMSMNNMVLPAALAEEAQESDAESKHKQMKQAIQDRTNAGLSFDYGRRYYYWQYYKENEDTDTLWNTYDAYKDWYIAARESSLKQEMMHLKEYDPQQQQQEEKKGKKKAVKLVQETWCAMSMEQWNDIEERSHHIHRTVKCKEMACDTSIWYKEYGVKEGDTIKKEHIIAILVFCTFDRIRNEFLLSFNQYYNTSLLVQQEEKKKKKKKKKKKHKHLLHYNLRGMEWMKRNHAFFAHLGRLLRESVECFGKRLNRAQQESFYFGINDALGLFKKMSCHFKLPLLCSRKMNVVLNYMQSDGLLIQIKYYQPFVRYFDCSFVTEFVSESEVIFNGGISMLKIESIYNIESKKNHLYFVRAMNILQSMLSGTMRKEAMAQYDEQVIRYLVQNEFIRAMNNENDNSSIVPYYVSSLFHHFCINLNAIVIDLRRMNDKSCSGYFAIKARFFTSHNNFVKLDVLCALFPNVPTIRIIGDKLRPNNCIKLDELFFDEVALILQSNLISHKCRLTKIIITHPNEDILTLEAAVDTYEAQFESMSCKFEMDTKTRTLVIHRSVAAPFYHQGNANQVHDAASNQACLVQ